MGNKHQQTIEIEIAIEIGIAIAIDFDFDNDFDPEDVLSIISETNHGILIFNIEGLAVPPTCNWFSFSVHPEVVDCDSDQGRSLFDTAGAVNLRRKSLNGFSPLWQKGENADRDRKMPLMDGH